VSFFGRICFLLAMYNYPSQGPLVHPYLRFTPPLALTRQVLALSKKISSKCSRGTVKDPAMSIHLLTRDVILHFPFLPPNSDYRAAPAFSLVQEKGQHSPLVTFSPDSLNHSVPSSASSPPHPRSLRSQVAPPQSN